MSQQPGPEPDAQNIPRHIAVIMDGNGRWAKKRGLPRMFGHREGVKSLEEVLRACSDIGVKWLTVYAFSTENWVRPEDEVKGIMHLFCETLDRKRDDFMKENVRLKVLGSRAGLPPEVLSSIDENEHALAANTGTTLNIAFNYGSRRELLDAAARCVSAGKAPATEDEFSALLYTAGTPDPELLIRTSGEERLSNFLLWQCAYSEFYFTETLWPDFRREQLLEAVRCYQGRKRRFGGI